MAGGSENNRSHQRNERQARKREFNAQKQALWDMVSEIQRTRQQQYVEESERRMRRNNERMQALMHIQQSVKDPMEKTAEINRFNKQWIQAELERSRALNEQRQALTNKEWEMHVEINKIQQQEFKELDEMSSRIHNQYMQKMEELNREIRKTSQKNEQSLKKLLGRTQRQGLNYSSHSKTKTKKKKCTSIYPPKLNGLSEM